MGKQDRSSDIYHIKLYIRDSLPAMCFFLGLACNFGTRNLCPWWASWICGVNQHFDEKRNWTKLRFLDQKGKHEIGYCHSYIFTKMCFLCQRDELQWRSSFISFSLIHCSSIFTSTVFFFFTMTSNWFTNLSWRRWEWRVNHIQWKRVTISITYAPYL